MARDDDGDGVLAVGETDGAGGVLVTEEFRERAVARGRAVGDLPQGIPHPVFERRADSFERQGECGAGAGEVFLELLSCAREHFGRRALLRFHPAGLVRRRGRRLSPAPRTCAPAHRGRGRSRRSSIQATSCCSSMPGGRTAITRSGPVMEKADGCWQATSRSRTWAGGAKTVTPRSSP